MGNSYPELRAQLLELLRERSVQRGPVTLASGRVSDFYVDCRPVALGARGATLIGELLFAHVQAYREQHHQIAGIGGLTLGADPLVTATTVVSARHQAPVHGFLVRKTPKTHGTQTYLERAAELRDGDPVLIVEDVVTTGGSARLACDRARAEGLQPIGVLGIVDRDEGGRDSFSEMQIDFSAIFTRHDF